MTTHTMKYASLLMMALASAGCVGADEDPATEAQSVDTAPLAARPASADFGAVAVGTTATQHITLTNTGRAPIDVSDVTYTATFPPDPCRAVLIQPCIRPGESTTLDVTCAPTTATAFGGRVAIRYQSASSGYALTVSVSGYGAARR